MAEVLGSGPEPGDPAHSRRRWTTPLVGVLIAAAAAYLAMHSGGGAVLDRSSAAGPSPDAPAGPAPEPGRSGPLPPAATYELDGVPGVGPAGVRMLVGGRQPGVLDAGTGRLAALPIPGSAGDVAELDHAGGTTIAVLHDADRLRARAVVLGPGGRTVRLGPVLDVVPMRDGSVLAEDCAGVGRTGACTVTGYAATGAVRWRRTAPGQLDLVRDTPYGRLQLVPALTTGANNAALPVWAPDGRLLLAVPTDGAGSGRVVVWQPGAPRVTILPVGLTGFYGLPGLAAPLS